MKIKNIFAKLPDVFFTKMSAEKFVKNPQLLHFNDELGSLLLIDREEFQKNLKKWITAEIKTFEPLAMVYAGHQFGHYVSRLGDGRALLLAQVKGKDDLLYDLQLKGSGLTPYSRMGDGRAVLRSSIREYLCSDAMHHLQIPTTRALALIATNEKVVREKIEPGAMILRVARTHIRFGHFEYFYYSNQHDELKILTNHVIENYFPEINSAQNKYEEFLKQVVSRTAQMIAKWQAVGFCHGVMNSDNMSILGDTIDYGPFGFMENFDPNWICNSSDYSGRYAYQEQPKIAAWNLYALAYALQPLVPLENSRKIVESFFAEFQENYSVLMCKKLGITKVIAQNNYDEIWQNLLQIMYDKKVDYSLTFVNLIKAVQGDEASFIKHFDDDEKIKIWLKNYLHIIKNFSTDEIISQMKKENPQYILRNWILQTVIEDAEKSDISRLEEIFEMIKNPYEENVRFENYACSAPAEYQNLCVSCSS